MYDGFVKLIGMKQDKDIYFLWLQINEIKILKIVFGKRKQLLSVHEPTPIATIDCSAIIMRSDVLPVHISVGHS